MYFKRLQISHVTIRLQEGDSICCSEDHSILLHLVSLNLYVFWFHLSTSDISDFAFFHAKRFSFTAGFILICPVRGCCLSSFDLRCVAISTSKPNHWIQEHSNSMNSKIACNILELGFTYDIVVHCQLAVAFYFTNSPGPSTD